jgi:hypothetical protein
MRLRGTSKSHTNGLVGNEADPDNSLVPNQSKVELFDIKNSAGRTLPIRRIIGFEEF